MRMTHSQLLTKIGTVIEQWQTAAKREACQITNISVTFPDGSAQVFVYLESEGVWDVTPSVSAPPPTPLRPGAGGPTPATG